MGAARPPSQRRSTYPTPLPPAATAATASSAPAGPPRPPLPTRPSSRPARPLTPFASRSLAPACVSVPLPWPACLPCGLRLVPHPAASRPAAPPGLGLSRSRGWTKVRPWEPIANHENPVPGEPEGRGGRREPLPSSCGMEWGRKRSPPHRTHSGKLGLTSGSTPALITWGWLRAALRVPCIASAT